MFQVTDFRLCRKTVAALKGFVFLKFFLGLPLRFAWVGLCRSSQVCSALRFFSLRSKKLGLACGHCYPSLSRSSNFFLWAFFFGGFAVVFLNLWVETHSHTTIPFYIYSAERIKILCRFEHDDFWSIDFSQEKFLPLFFLWRFLNLHLK